MDRRALEPLRAAAQATDLSETAWLTDICRAAAAVLGAEAGVFAYTYRIENRRSMVLGSIVSEGTPRGFWEALHDWGGENMAAIASMCSTSALSLTGALRAFEARGVRVSDARASFEPHDVRDLAIVNAHDRDAHGLFLTAPRRREASLRDTEWREMARLASELSFALALRRAAVVHPERPLSKREREVARLIACGESDKQIAVRLGIALSSVSTYAKRVRAKLGLGKRGELLWRSQSAHAIDRRLALLRLLTASEHEIAIAIVSGASYREIAATRGSSARTVASQVASIFRKCGVSGRRELTTALLGASGK